MRKVLILGGTGEASSLAQALSSDDRYAIVNSLAGRTRSPAALPGETRIGGFGGAEAMAGYLASEGIAAVIDATHPYAPRISAHAAAACTTASVPLVRFHRAPWARRQGDSWTDAADIEDAARLLPERTRVFVTTGRQELEPFIDRKDLWLLIRVIDMPDAALDPARGKIIAARGPFAVSDETRLMQENRIEWLVSKNSGGGASYAKIEAARSLGLPVIMVARPGEGSAVATVENIPDALAWLETA